MDKIATDAGRVAHITADIADAEGGRLITTVCGKTYHEETLHVDEDLDACKACMSKYEAAIKSSDDTEFPE